VKIETRHNCIVAYLEAGELGLSVRMTNEITNKAPSGAVIDSHIARMLGAILVAGLPEDLEVLFAVAEAEALTRAVRLRHDPTHKTLSGDALVWLAVGKQGLSSRALFAVTTGVAPEGMRDATAVPYDADDFRRCALLYNAVPEVRENLHQARTLGPVWTILVDRWAALMEIHQEGDAKTLNDILRRIHEPARA